MLGFLKLSYILVKNLPVNFYQLSSKFYLLETFNFIKLIFWVILIESLVLDDEPLFEPIEWSVTQTWVIYIYLFSWVAEVLISSRYGFYTNRDKIVWVGLIKSYYIAISWVILNIIIVFFFITLPFYFEITYVSSYPVNLWNWLTSLWIFKLVSIFSVLLILTIIIKSVIRAGMPYLKLELVFTIFFILIFVLFFIFLITWVGYLTNAASFSYTGQLRFYNIINGPNRWGWGAVPKDHFSYHRTPESVWSKNDLPFTGSILILNLIVFLFILTLTFKFMILLRLLFTDLKISYNNITIFVTSIQFILKVFYLIFITSFFVWISYFLKFPYDLTFYQKFLILSSSLLKLIFIV